MTNVTMTIEMMEAQVQAVNEATATLNEMFAAFKAQSITTVVEETVIQTTEVIESAQVETEEEAETRGELQAESDWEGKEPEMSEEDMAEYEAYLAKQKDSQEVVELSQKDRDKIVIDELKESLKTMEVKNFYDELEEDDEDEEDEEVTPQRMEEDIESNMQDMQDAGAIQSLANELTKQVPQESVAPAKKPSILDMVKIPGVAMQESTMDELISSYAQAPVAPVQVEVKEEVVEEVVAPEPEVTQPEPKKEEKPMVTPVRGQNIAVIAAPTTLSDVFNSGRLSHHHQTQVFIKEAAHALHMTMLGMIQRGVDTFHVSEFNGLELFIVPFAWREVRKAHPNVKLVLFTNNGRFQSYCDTLEEEKARGVYSPRRMSVGLRSMAHQVIEVTGNAYALRKAAVAQAGNVIRFMPQGQQDVATRLYNKLPGARVNICPWSLLATRQVGSEVMTKQFPASHDYNPAVMPLVSGKDRAVSSN